MNHPENTSLPTPPKNPIPISQQTNAELPHETKALRATKPSSPKKSKLARTSLADLLPHAALELRSANTGLILATPFNASLYKASHGTAASARDIAYSVAYYERRASIVPLYFTYS
jgi:hypothetical protein